MKHTTEDLLLASHVLKTASSMASNQRTTEWKAWRAEQSTSPSQEESDAKHRELEHSHPTDAYIAQALARLESVADTIKAHRM